MNAPGARPRALPGREPERERFAECLDEARQGIPTLLLFEGESGSGKSALLDEIETSPLLPRKLIRVARIDLGDGLEPDPVKRAAALLVNTSRLARLGGRRRVFTALRKVLPEWMGTIPVWGNILQAVAVTTRAVRRRVRKAEPEVKLAEDIAALHDHAQRRPTALLIDDLHIIGEAAADRMFRLMKHAPTGTRLLIIATVTTPPPGLRRPAVRILQDRLPADRVRHHRLGSLNRADIDEWLRFRFHPALPDSVVDFLLAESGGQPGAVQHLLDRLIDSGALRSESDGWRYDEALSDAQLDAMEPTEVHLGNLSQPVAEVVSAASVFGDEFDALALARLLDLDELELEDRLAVATRFGLLAIAGDQTYDDGEISTRYRFASSALRAALHRDLPAARRRELEARMPDRPAPRRY